MEKIADLGLRIADLKKAGREQLTAGGVREEGGEKTEIGGRRSGVGLSNFQLTAEL